MDESLFQVQGLVYAPAVQFGGVLVLFWFGGSSFFSHVLQVSECSVKPLCVCPLKNTMTSPGSFRLCSCLLKLEFLKKDTGGKNKQTNKEARKQTNNKAPCFL